MLVKSHLQDCWSWQYERCFSSPSFPHFFLALFLRAAFPYPNAWNRLPSSIETLFRLLLVEMNLPLRFLFLPIALGVITSSVSRKRKSQCWERASRKWMKVNPRVLVPREKSRNAQKVCAVTIVGSVLKTNEDIALQSGEILLTSVWSCPPTPPAYKRRQIFPNWSISIVEKTSVKGQLPTLAPHRGNQLLFSVKYMFGEANIA